MNDLRAGFKPIKLHIFTLLKNKRLITITKPKEESLWSQKLYQIKQCIVPEPNIPWELECQKMPVQKTIDHITSNFLKAVFHKFYLIHS